MARATGLRSLTLGLVLVAVAACDGQRSTDTTSVPLADHGAQISPEGPPPPPAGAFLAQMSPEQTSQLNGLGVDVVVPGEVPPSFSIVEMRLDQSGPAYLVVYQNEANQCFAVEFAATGIDAPPATEGRLPIQPPLFSEPDSALGGTPGDAPGYGLNYGPFAAADMRAQFPEPNLFTDWLIGPSGAYRLIGAAYIGDLFEPLRGCEDIAPQDAVALAESLTVLTTDSMGEPVAPGQLP